MKNFPLLIVLCLTLICCSKEPEGASNTEPEVSVSEIEAIKKELAELKAIVDSLLNSEEKPTLSVSIEDLNILKEENETLKSQVATLMSTFFEVDGLRFDKNGDVISVPKIESSYEKQTNTGNLTMTRTFDEHGRLIETYGQYSGYNSSQTPPYYWQRKIYEYNDKTVTTNTETSSYSYGIYTHKESSVITYW